MAYLQVEIRTGSLAAEVLADFLTEQGALGVATEDPEAVRRRLAEPGSYLFADEAFLADLPDYTLVKGWFSEAEPAQAGGRIEVGGRTEAGGHVPPVSGRPHDAALVKLIENKLKEMADFLPVAPAEVYVSELEEDDWAVRWKQYFKPYHVSSRFVIVPSWENYVPAEGETVIRLDPGAAFGTGQHKSTALLIALMEKWLEPGKTTYDVGCGSGILSLVADRLGIASGAATDLDPVAAETCRRNITEAGLAEKILVRTGDIHAFQGQRYDFILMNIVADVILAMRTDIPNYLKTGGKLLCSGLLDERVPELEEALAKVGLVRQDSLSSGGWTALVFA